MNGRFKFVFSWTTGKVVSERAMKVNIVLARNLD